MAREQYHRELNKVKDGTLRMGELAKIAVRDSVVALKERNVKLAEKVIAMDKDIDSLEHQIEDSCLALLALQQPMARDLRMIAAVLRIIIDLERIGDLALEIAVITKATAREPHIKPLVDIPRMSSICQEMIEGAMRAFETCDAELARRIARRDDEVDALFDQIRRELITYMIEDPKKITNASHLTFVARYLERIGDHANNLCESTVFMAAGERVELN
ncbi:phosphate transport system regulatory protein PhoU [Candidatus Methanoperedens nitroreducens]|uniref:Phosphate-specific transport system accessory protein PhoU n=1 Tax=Candidatus Methanoperedens nitratireducens TaxID=1392998 RepID=A0A062V1Y0_9EURY|nr:phosphate signaling complex protein PhoU [Candidatus Methanoperedens nitroreducens]KCZ71362.1 phosphate transport system regulatory protein PhoU [Candidatus Methanoperedens nitroreducens]MDJ1420991.1 phosphate signaling complex protein PhoU [Candidatus Methanoperedens sp.]